MSEPGAIPVKRSGTYFARHWRGDLSLPQSFWFSGVTIGFAWLVAFQPLADFFVIAPWWFFIACIAYYATIVWQLVGIWRSLTTQFGSNMRVKTALSQRCRGLFREIVELNLLDVDIPVVTAFFEALFNLKVPPILGSEPNIWDEIRGHLASLADDFTRYVQDRDGPSKEYLRNRQPIVLSYLHGAAQRDYRRFPKEVDISIAEVHSGQKMAGNAIDIDVNPQPGIALVTMERHGLARGTHVIVSIEFPMQQGREQIVAIGVVRRVWGDTGVAVVLESSRSQVDRTPTDADPIEHEADGIEKWKRYAMLQTQIK